MEEELKEHFLKLVDHTASSHMQLQHLQSTLNSCSDLLNECRWFLLAIAVFTGVIMWKQF
jgi:type II secretory pathway component PulF